MQSFKDLSLKINNGVFGKDSTNNEGRIVVTTPDNEVCATCFGTGFDKERVQSCQTCRPSTEENRRKVLLEKIPSRYRGVTLENLEPWPNLHPAQAQHINYMRSNPSATYCICGKNDTGKTRFLYALYDHAVRTGRNVFVSTLFEIIEAIKKSFDDPVAARKVFSLHMADLSQTTFPYSIFIDDVAMARPTDFVAERFFDIVNRIYVHKHQLVVTTHIDTEALVDHFDQADGSYGLGIARRIVNEGTAILRMF